jgi:hypothetical protein
MDHTRFDQLVRSFSRSRSRRGLLAAAGGFIALGFKPAGANQLLPATCAQTGQVCTMLYGCCSGLTCATSSINPSYGVCVPGEGGMVTTGTSLVVPFDSSDTAQAQSVSNAVTDTSTSTTTTTTIDDREAEQDAREAERDARKAQVEARRDTKKDNLETRRDTQQQRREDEREAADAADGPDLEFAVVNGGTASEYLFVRNGDDISAVLQGIAKSADAKYTLLGSKAVTLQPGEVFRFTRPASDTITETSYGWTDEIVCGPSTNDQGFLLLASFTASGASTEFTIPCSTTSTAATTNSSDDQQRRRRRKRSARGRQQSRGKQKSRGKGK